ncbi:MAG: sensor histidine kinase [Anaerolineales bacterium]|nr:sensor histidine kinase [Anaerolineales bacterium]
MSFEILFIVYFIYGLAFFSMGLILVLEASRTPSLEQKRLLLPLAVFGLLHGVNEWLDIFALQNEQLHGNLPIWSTWFRLTWLALSFIALWFYGWQSFQVARAHVNPFTFFGLATLPPYLLLILIDVLYAFHQGDITPLQTTGGLVRYLLAVPGAAIASLGLRAGANRAKADSQQPLDTYYNLAALGFALYSVTQLAVPKMDTILASLINAEAFTQMTGLPIQVLRTFAAIIITLNLFRAIHFLEEERQAQFAAARQARLEALEQQEIMRRDLLRHIVRAQEEERARIARELHDEMAQTLTAFTLDLGTLKQITGARSKSVPILARLQELGKQMSQSMHQMVYDLRPAHLDDLGLLPALKFLADKDGPRLGLQIQFKTTGEPHRIDSLAETVLFRVAQESMTNIARHSKSKHACICINYLPQEVKLEVMDDGVGFDPGEKFAAPRGWGLAGMKERAESVGGRFEVKSEAGRGTTVRVNIPIQQEV